MEFDPKQKMTQESPKDQTEGQNQAGQLRKIGLFTLIISELVGFSCIGVGFGYFAWSKWHAPWWVLLLSSITGLCVAFYRVYQLSQREL